MKKYKFFAILSVCFLIVILLFLYLNFLPSRTPIIPNDTKWYSSVNNMHIESYYDSEFQITDLSGTLLINDDIIELKIGIRDGRLFFSCEQFSLIMTADYTLDKECNMILKHINYSEDVEWQSTPKKIVLEKDREK